MKTKSSSFISARAALGALFLMASVILVVLALNPKMLQGKPRDLQKEAASAPAPDSVLPPSGILFTHNTLVDFSAGGGEPFINSAPVAIPAPSPNVNSAPPTPAGAPFISVPFGFSTTVSLLWKSMDGGRSFIQLGTPIVRDSVAGPGGGDTHQYFDALGRFYFCDLSAACVTTAVSDDGGNTFPKENPASCLGPNDPGGAQDDRQWIGAFGDGRGYTTVRNLAVSVGGNFHMNTTRDAGMTWAGSQSIGTVSQSGPMVVDRSKRNFGGSDYIVAYQMYYSGGTLNAFRIRDPDTGAAVLVDNLTIGTPGTGIANVFPTIAIDTAGNLYVTFSDTTAIYLMTSTDRGDTWSNVKRVSPTTGSEGTGTIIMPWVIAGDPGRADIVWYRGSIAGNSTSTDNRWDIYMAQTLNAFATSPTFSYTKVNETNIHFGQICLGGTFCDVTVPPGTNDRSFLEFPSITLDDRGAAQITWNDNTNQAAVTAANPTVTGLPYVMFSKQLCGPSLFTSVGDVGQAGTVAITAPANNAVVTSPVTVQGTHTLPPATFDKDEAGDALFPDHGPVIGTNVPALDIRQVDMTENATNIIVHMQVADATTAALATATGTGGGDGLLYLVQWDYDESTADPIDKVFWVAAEVRAGQALGRTGTLGVIRSATSKKYITYNPDAVNSVQVTVNISNTAPGTITLTIPRSLVGNPPNGASLYSVTGYAMSERGPLAATPCPPAPASCENIFDPTSLPIRVDTAGAFTYVIGAGMQLDGVVQLSLDDPTFSFPTPATANLNGTWQGTLTGVSGGQHRVYARQVVRGGCATSLTPSVLFTVPGGVPSLTSVVSRFTHGGVTPPPVGPGDISLPLPVGTGPRAVEPRSSASLGAGNYQLVFTFANALTNVGGASVTSHNPATGTGSVSGAPMMSGNTCTVNLTGVSNAQYMQVTLTGVADIVGNTGNVLSPELGILIGDVNGNGVLTNADVSLVKAQVAAGGSVTTSNFRDDVNANGVITNADVSVTKAQVAAGTQLPSTP
jgi:hypothetical protein